MSSNKDFVSRQGRFNLQRISRRTCSGLSEWRQETPKRSSSRSRPSIAKQIKKLDKCRQKTESKLSIRKKTNKSKRPEPPHNTTQYIIDANTSCAEAPNLYLNQDRFEFDFKHHAMAGSMMDMMRGRFSQMYDQSTTVTSVSDKLSCSNEDLTQDNMVHESQSVDVQEFHEVPIIHDGELSGIRDAGLVNFVDSDLGTDLCLNVEDRDVKEINPYDQYLKQIEAGGDLKGLVQHLVTLLTERDEEISSLKMQLSNDEQ